MAVPSQTSGVNTGGVGNIPTMQSTVTQPQYVQAPGASAPVNTNAGAPTTGTTGTTGAPFDWTQFLGGLFGGAASIYGSQNAAEAMTKGNQAAIGTQFGTLGNINNLFGAQTSLGTGAMNTLGSTLGTNGQPADYSNFYNMPGYQFAVDQGTRALQRQASASGSAYTPNTGAAIGQYVTGTAMQDYNTYIGQLMNAAGLGAQANNTLTGANLTVGGNISQLQSNIGVNQASGVNSGAGTIGSFLGNKNNLSQIGSWLQKGYNYLTGPNSSGVAPVDPNNSGDMTGGSYNGGAFGGGAPLYDPTTGGYPGAPTDTGGSIGNMSIDPNGDPFGGYGGGPP